MDTKNRQWLLVNRPEGWPTPEDFRLVENPVPQPGEGQALVRTLYVSVDPYMRGRMRDVKSYAPPVPLEGVMEAGAVGRVVKSRTPNLAEGDIVEGRLGWQDYAIENADRLRKVDPELAPISTAVGVLGMPGLTAYFGLFDVLRPQPGETVLVSGAAGAVGSIVGQLAKIHGCPAYGVAGSEEKVRWVVDELGFDDAFNYKTHEDYEAAIAAMAPGGVDCYFDNVGGRLTDAALAQLNIKGRIAVCGQISQYNLDKPEMGPRPFWPLIAKRARIEGFLVFEFAERYREGLEAMGRWIREGRLKYRETVVEGLENTPQAFIDMMRGANLGKMVVKVAEA